VTVHAEQRQIVGENLDHSCVYTHLKFEKVISMYLEKKYCGQKLFGIFHLYKGVAYKD